MSRKNCNILWGLAFFMATALGITSPVPAQFSVLSTIPADGATNVDTSITFQINFSAPVDTSARFA